MGEVHESRAAGAVRNLTCARAVLAALLLINMPSAARAQDPVKWSAQPGTGGQKTITLHAHIDPGWHIYSLTQPPGGPVPTTITVPAGQPWTSHGTVTQPKPISRVDENFGMTVEMFEGDVSFTVPVRVTAKSPAASSIGIKVRYQACNARLCLPARTQRITVSMRP